MERLRGAHNDSRAQPLVAQNDIVRLEVDKEEMHKKGLKTGATLVSAGKALDDQRAERERLESKLKEA